MRIVLRHKAKKVGLTPGSLVHIGERKAERTRIKVMDYDAEQLTEKDLETVEECLPFKKTPTTTWIGIEGLHRPELMEEIGKFFDIHPLVMEDVLHTNQRPKIEEFDEYLFAVMRTFHFNNNLSEIHTDQFSLVLRKDCLITFEERPSKIFEPVMERIRKKKGRIRSAGTDYLAYALIDTIVDHYFVVLEKISEKLEQLDAEVANQPLSSTLKNIHLLKNGLARMRKSIWPLREMVAYLTRIDSPLIDSSTKVYLRDLYDHTIQIADSIDTFRDMASGLLEIYLSNTSNRMNEVMKVLTIFAAIFIPLTFLAGIYGMNFEFMPELKWHYAYFIVLGIMLSIALCMVAIFKRKKWF